MTHEQRNAGKAEAINALKAMQRGSADGQEITITPVYRAAADWRYCAIKYSLNVNDTTPTVILTDYKNKTWAEIAEQAAKLLEQHKTTGFYFG